ncbi:xylulose 5-phosphate/phosphate translocator, chloroplastic-like [Phoenix dactylifera]|uniref:Xylulose 5-phosphate/phosphate translocator, chloroplastic-like n=1 Tax=Phoenix dactylifera TaxID=42345 RepID=A0A8B7CX04_PHODC|nr:xylulose 5-phosphate/phosphate translocator, chloroplastic-like [Phoenix dactylifera]
MLSLQLPFSSCPLLRHTKTQSPVHGSRILRPYFPPHTTLGCLRDPTRLRPSVLLQTPTHGSPILIPRAAAAAAAADGDPDAPPGKEKQEEGIRELKDGEDSIPDLNEDDSTGKSMAENERKSKTTTPNSSTSYLAVVFGLWYFQNVVFNIYNKKVLNIFPYPWLLASFQLFVGSLWMAFLWASRLQPFPRVSKRFFAALLGPALFHTIGHISACVSFSKVAVSFTHVIKASEPVFSVVFSAFLGRFYPIQVWLSVLPIVAGCSLAAVTEVSFNAQGLWTALISNVGFVLRNIYSKQSLQDFSHINGLNLYGWISIVSLLYLFPVAVFVEGSRWPGGFQRALAAVPSPWTFYWWVLLSGIFYHLYNQSSYQALDKISPLTFSVGNTMKRVVVIIASVLVFRNPIRPLNALGSAIAILGTFLYSQATTMGKKENKAVPEKKTS